MSGQDILIEQLRADVELMRNDRADLQERCNRLSAEKAEALRMLVDAERERDEARANYAFMVERAADQKLDGYRELGARAAAAEERAEKAERERDEAVSRAGKLESMLADVRIRFAKHSEEHKSLFHRVTHHVEMRAKAEDERDQAIAERDARPDISAEDARLMEDGRAFLELPPYEHGAEHQEAAIRIASALRAHAAKAVKP